MTKRRAMGQAKWARFHGLAPLGALLALGAACSTAAEPSADTSAAPLDGAIVRANFRTAIAGKYLCAENAGGGAVNANRDAAREWETFSLVDQNGGALESGDLVFIQAFGGEYLQAANGGGSTLNAASPNRLGWETFRVVREAGRGTVQNGDVVGLQAATTGNWVSAENGGGGPVFAYGAALGPWERLVIGLGAAPPPPPPPAWNLVWADEFDGNGGGPNESAWRYDVQRPGWVNHELESYTANRRENARIENGVLVIEGRRDWFGGDEYSSARINSNRSFTYGRLEVRAKLPAGRGTWPAIWMMPDDQSRGWPSCGEIDVMEHVGYDVGNVHASIHTGKYNWPMHTQKTAVENVPDATNAFHVYALEWFPDHLDAFVDGTKYFTFANEGTPDTWPYDKPFHVILNLAIGGDWGGAMGVDPNVWPQRMEVDYVRIYQK